MRSLMTCISINYSKYDQQKSTSVVHSIASYIKPTKRTTSRQKKYPNRETMTTEF